MATDAGIEEDRRLEDLGLVGGTIIDGTGAARFRADVYISGGRISRISQDLPGECADVIDCTDLVVAPGFIDGHSHSDLQVLHDAPEKIRQGVTFEVVGNCGFSPYPTGEKATELREFANGILFGDEHWDWRDAKSYLEEVKINSRIGVGSLVGHGSLRVAVAGHRLGELPPESVDRMAAILDQSFDDGAIGLSTGLMYSPGASSPLHELDRLCSVVARRGKLHATHMRDYSDDVYASLEEQIGIAARTECKLQISHFQVVGPRNWPKQREALDLIEKAHSDGVDIAFDCYPYTRGSTVMTQLLPQHAMEGGISGLLRRLKDPVERRSIAIEMNRTTAQGWSGILISAIGSPDRQDLVGLSIAEIAEMRSMEPASVVLDLLIQEKGAVNMLEINQSEENLKDTVTHPLANIISDGIYVKGRPHPRLYGTFPYFLGELCRRRGWLSLEEGVQKITDKPAQRFGIRDRGRVKNGYYADIVIFDPEAIDSTATYENPRVPPIGIQCVLREGRTLIRDGRETN